MTADTRARIVAAAGVLFARDGIRGTGVNSIIAASGVAKATFYRHFRSKDELVAAWLESTLGPRSEDVLTAMDEAGSTAAERIDALFDSMTERLEAPDFAGYPFISAALAAPDSPPPVRDLVHRQLGEAREVFRALAVRAAAGDPDSVAAEIQLLLLGLMIRVRAEPESRAEAGTIARGAAQRLLATSGEVQEPRDALPSCGSDANLSPSTP